MTPPYQRSNAPRKKPKSDGDTPQWQLVIGGIFVTVISLLAGSKIAEMTFAIWMPGWLR